MRGLAIQKLLNKPNKRVHQTLLPLRRGEKTTTKIQSAMRPTRRTTPHQWFKHHPTSTHHNDVKQSHKPTKQNHWHTIEFSHNTRTPKHTPKILGPVQSGLTDPTHTHTTNKIACHANQMKGSTSDCFPTAISPKPVPIGPPGGALSVTLTPIKLHTPNQQHKPAG